ncbi:glycosyltransferase family 2 protein [Sphingomonas sp. A2-49]|uniref:glycosyltransferase family 2 protein n=1 Tax=Sphingomonas sp. A2-49 TaxID=1391375 RepID=UPI0021D110DC|nr:glycosyltransferase family A protein [Sphingomonas sp. A2-49]MCU6454534.1 glycosyltransferase family 2 protein [Sphingomonas sp. A2-49]
MIAVTLLLCTRDRGESLDRTLASITRAAARGPAVEAVVVDNGSSDDTPERLSAWRDAQAFAVTLVREPRAGLARARNAGLARARGRIVAMTDDDCVLDAGFFEQVAARFALASAPVVIGGRILLGDPADLPVTIKLEDHAMVADPGGYPGGFVMGANLAFTRDVVDRIGGFDERFGAGARFRAAEDTDFLFRATGCGIPVRYDPYIVVTHHHGRRTANALRRLLAGYAFGDGAVYAKHILRDARIVRAVRTDIGNLVAERRTRAVVFEQIRFFHAFRCRGIARGFAAYVLSMGSGLVRGGKVRPNRHTFRQNSGRLPVQENTTIVDRG